MIIATMSLVCVLSLEENKITCTQETEPLTHTVLMGDSLSTETYATKLEENTYSCKGNKIVLKSSRRGTRWPEHQETIPRKDVFE